MYAQERHECEPFTLPGESGRLCVRISEWQDIKANQCLKMRVELGGGLSAL